ncbi:glycosyltransferase involved in cell wall biosynthesis [Fluviicoccus keumensis]|uniref:Glycosyltransferase involved in cell wall biosynthesis n=1 Tax=Fluviicoccus keumensis TaxID=1435465 RepID=A0A4V2G646_9GAMM|nr:glycosyltransferase family 2 protein [Fluviicoccus keumensis]RZU47256.1 glycosyltransferase involved in cell wall biosynthesis [Fluviicoccus keumensis]
MIPASVYLITKNCEETLDATLASVQDFAEIVLVDSGSTDRTLEIAGRYGCRIWHQDWLGYAGQKTLALSYCTQDWVLNLDGDEVLSPELKAEIIDCIEYSRADGLDIPIHDYFLGFPPPRFGRFNRRVRFFRRATGAYDTGKQVHESITVQGAVKQAAGAIRHYGENTIAIKVDKNNLYSSLRAREKAAKGKQASVLKLVLVFPLTFIKSYVFRRAFLNGKRGFISSTVNAFYAFLKEAKLYEANLKAGQGQDRP